MELDWAQSLEERSWIAVLRGIGHSISTLGMYHLSFAIADNASVSDCRAVAAPVYFLL